nr:hypothetical protein [Micromonospora provocatoris]
MRRRPVALLTAAVLGAALTGCSEQPTAPAGRPAPDAPPTTTTPAPRVPAGKAPTESFAVGVRQVKLNRDGDRPLPVTLWYPAAGAAGGAAERSAAAADGRFPVVLFSHGLSARPEDYQALLTRWAAAGFVVAAPRFPHTSRGTDGNPLDVLNQPADVSYVLTRVLALGEKAGDPLRGRLTRSGWPRPGTAPAA